MKNLTAPWLKDSGLEGPQGTISSSAVRSVDHRSNIPGGGYSITAAKPIRGNGRRFPFTIALRDRNQLLLTDSAGVLPRSITLLINPSDLSIGSSFEVSSQFTRSNYVNTLWGANQGTILGNGSSAAFITKDGGLAGTSVEGVSRRDTLAYANLMSFVALIRSNGYYQLTTGTSSQAGSSGQTAVVGPSTGSSAYEATSGEAPKGVVSQTDVKVEESSMVAGMLGYNRSGVVHVLDTVSICYGGTEYLGSFSSFTLEASGESPFAFTYSFEFVIAGLLGERVSGHIHDGKNSTSGVVIAVQGTNFLNNQGSTDKALLNEAVSVPFSESVFEDTEQPAEGAVLAAYQSSQIYRVAYSWTNMEGLDKRIVDILPLIKKAFEACSVTEGVDVSGWYPPIITSAKDGRHSDGSRHYVGLAVDIRSKTLPNWCKPRVLAAMKELLPKTYFAQIEFPGSDNEHYHVEWD